MGYITLQPLRLSQLSRHYPPWQGTRILKGKYGMICLGILTYTLSVFGVGQLARVVSEGRVKYLARAHFQPSNRRLKQYRRGDVMESWDVDSGKGAISTDCKG